MHRSNQPTTYQRLGVALAALVVFAAPILAHLAR